MLQPDNDELFWKISFQVQDCWSLGCVLVWLLTGTDPFTVYDEEYRELGLQSNSEYQKTLRTKQAAWVSFCCCCYCYLWHLVLYEGVHLHCHFVCHHMCTLLTLHGPAHTCQCELLWMLCPAAHVGPPPWLLLIDTMLLLCSTRNKRAVPRLLSARPFRSSSSLRIPRTTLC